MSKMSIFQTKEKLIKSLTLDGQLELVEKADGLGVDLETYIESVHSIKDMFVIDSKLVNTPHKVNKYQNQLNDK